MTQTLEAMRRRIETAEDLHGVVRVMKALAAASVRQYETAVESVAEYRRTIEAGLQIVLHNRPEAIAAQDPGGGRWGVIVFGSDQGMCGSFNEQVGAFALEQLAALPGTREDRSIVVVGSRVAGRLEDAGYAVDEPARMPSTVSGITAAVSALLLEVEKLRFQEGIEQLLLIHHRPSGPVGSAPDRMQLLPIDRDWLEAIATRRWDSRSLPTFSMDWRQLLSALIRQHLFVVLYRAFAESLASENASRLASMHTAERNIQGHLSRLSSDYHQSRQQQITEELLDIVAGFETLTAEESSRAGSARKL
ncbi:MAG: F0F1 ATP synthase subunit gamma [Burkholderiaceae bacterium]